MTGGDLVANSRPIVLVDMDGVLADFDGYTRAYLETSHPDVPIIEQRRQFYYKDEYLDPDHQGIIDGLHASRGFFLNLPLIEGAISGWNRIYELGYYPRILSSPLRSNEWCVQEKIEWIRVHFGETVAREAIIDSAKELHDGVVLIDDRPALHNAHIATWKHVVFDQSYNREAEAEYRLYGWGDEGLGGILGAATGGVYEHS